MPLPSDHAHMLDLGPYTHVTILGLGRGISEKGELDHKAQMRVRLTLLVARALQKHAKVLIIWTGFKNLKQVKDNVTIGGAGSEGAAYMAFAETLIKKGDEFEQMAETMSTSTVGNMAHSAEHVPPNSLIVPVTDTLHFMYGRVLFAARLMFPGRDIRLIEMDFKYTRKEQLKQLLSATATVIFMTGVKRGNKEAVLKRQARAERATGWLFGR